MRRPMVLGAARRAHSKHNKSSITTAAIGCFGGSAETCSAQKGTIACTNRKSGEYSRIPGRTYGPGAAFRASIMGIPTDSVKFATLPRSIVR
jgi:hypothetical protein